MRAIAADYKDEYQKLVDDYGFSKEQMLVVLKAYQLLTMDNERCKDELKNGWLGKSYMIAPKIFHKAITISTDDLVRTCCLFWEFSNDQKNVRLSKMGKAFVEENKNLFVAAKEIIVGVSELQ